MHWHGRLQLSPYRIQSDLPLTGATRCKSSKYGQIAAISVRQSATNLCCAADLSIKCFPPKLYKWHFPQQQQQPRLAAGTKDSQFNYLFCIDVFSSTQQAVQLFFVRITVNCI